MAAGEGVSRVSIWIFGQWVTRELYITGAGPEKYHAIHRRSFRRFGMLFGGIPAGILSAGAAFIIRDGNGVRAVQPAGKIERTAAIRTEGIVIPVRGSPAFRAWL